MTTNTSAAIALTDRSATRGRRHPDGKDRRSPARARPAEAAALRAAVHRALETDPDVPCISLLDFGHGAGQVTKEFVVEYPVRFARAGVDLRVVVHAASGAALGGLADALCHRHSFQVGRGFHLPEDDAPGAVAGSLRRVVGGVDMTVVLVRGDATGDFDEMSRLVREANSGEQFLVTTSWYRGLGQVPGAARRDACFAALDELTRPDGEMLIAVPSRGAIPASHRRRDARRTRPREQSADSSGDARYEPERARFNYWHLFGADLSDHLQRICRPGQRGWIEAVRLPDDEFLSPVEEKLFLAKLRELNERKRDEPWAEDDYRLCRAVLAARSACPPSEEG